ncbi:MAG: hypothetical protein QOI32_828 [Thermoleophilaceae bacterium]|nr:hypothetical protein [Thermoleophilaceae bacterium]
MQKDLRAAGKDPVTPRLTRISVFAIAAVFALAAAPGAFAASESADAGELPSSAQDLGDGPVTQVFGSFSSASDSDVYRICLTDGATFSASTVGATTLDSQMFLFDSQGFGVYSNDDANGSRGSLLPAHHRFSPATGGEYFLAISQYNHDPQSVMGEIFQDNYSRFSYPDGVLNANGFGGAEPITGWSGRAQGGIGVYLITLTGTKRCVPPDTTPPTAVITSPADGAQVPQGANLVVDFSCSDEGSSGLASCVGSTADGALLDTSKLGPVSVTVTARDGAGNETVVKHTVTVVDETAPGISITTPVDGADYARNQHVAATYSCADEANGSGLASCAGDVADGADIDTSTLGDHTFTVTTADNAGNTDSRSVTYTVVDTTGPSISIATPVNGATYGLGQSVTAGYSCADEDGGSGVATCAGPVASGAAVDTSSLGAKTFTVNATDNAGNPTSRSVTYTVADQQAPTITVTTPADGAVYSPGQRVLAAYSCADQPGGSGVAACQGTVANGAAVDTAGFGPHSFVVNATDAAGNSSSRTVTYTVGYRFRGFLSPVQNLPGVNRWKAGKRVPIRFSLDGFKGARPEADGYPRSARCGGGDVDQVERERGSRRRPVFEYERRLDTYVLLWKTERKWAGSCREFVLKLDDGSVHTARFEFVKRERGKKKSDDDDHDDS